MNVGASPNRSGLARTAAMGLVASQPGIPDAAPTSDSPLNRGESDPRLLLLPHREDHGLSQIRGHQVPLQLGEPSDLRTGGAVRPHDRNVQTATPGVSYGVGGWSDPLCREVLSVKVHRKPIPSPTTAQISIQPPLRTFGPVTTQ